MPGADEARPCLPGLSISAGAALAGLTMEGGEADPLPARLRRQSNSVSSFSLILLLLRCWPLEVASESATHLFHQSRQTAVHS